MPWHWGIGLHLQRTERHQWEFFPFKHRSLKNLTFTDICYSELFFLDPNTVSFNLSWNLEKDQIQGFLISIIRIQTFESYSQVISVKYSEQWVGINWLETCNFDLFGFILFKAKCDLIPRPKGLELMLKKPWILFFFFF